MDSLSINTGAPAAPRALAFAPPLRTLSRSTQEADVWSAMRAEAEAALIEEPLYAGLIQATVLDQRKLPEALAYRLAHRLGDGDLSRLTVRDSASPPSRPIPEAGRTRCAISRHPRARPDLPALSRSISLLQGLRRARRIPVSHWLWHQAAPLSRCICRAASPKCSAAISIGGADRLGRVHRPRHGVVIARPPSWPTMSRFFSRSPSGGNGKESGDRQSEDRARRAAQRRRQGPRQHPGRRGAKVAAGRSGPARGTRSYHGRRRAGSGSSRAEDRRRARSHHGSVVRFRRRDLTRRSEPRRERKSFSS